MMARFGLHWDAERSLYWLQDEAGQNLGAMIDQSEFAQCVLRAFEDQQKLVRVMKRLAALRKLTHEVEAVIHGDS